MKKTKSAIIVAAIVAAFTVATRAQSPTPSPTPYDALHIVPAASPALTLAQEQQRAHGLTIMASRNLFAALKIQYMQTYTYFNTDDSGTGGLTIAQKYASLSPSEQTELITNAWLIANLLNGVSANTVPNPVTPPSQ